MRLGCVLGGCLSLAACAGQTPSPALQDRTTCLAEQAGRLGVGPDARATAELLCSSSFTHTNFVDTRCPAGRTLAQDGSCVCVERLESLGAGVGCRVSRGPDWQDVRCGAEVDLCGTPRRCTCE